jgi:hypothetical protein
MVDTVIYIVILIKPVYYQSHYSNSSLIVNVYNTEITTTEADGSLDHGLGQAQKWNRAKSICIIFKLIKLLLKIQQIKDL